MQGFSTFDFSGIHLESVLESEGLGYFEGMVRDASDQDGITTRCFLNGVFQSGVCSEGGQDPQGQKA